VTSQAGEAWLLPPPQVGLLFHALYNDGPDMYAVQQVFEVGGALDTGALRAAGQEVLARHAELRVSFRQPAGLGPLVRVVLAEVELPWR
jgi:hypothetical protein